MKLRTLLEALTLMLQRGDTSGTADGSMLAKTITTKATRRRQKRNAALATHLWAEAEDGPTEREKKRGMVDTDHAYGPNCLEHVEHHLGENRTDGHWGDEGEWVPGNWTKEEVDNVKRDEDVDDTNDPVSD